MTQSSVVIKKDLNLPSGMSAKTSFDKAHAMLNNRTRQSGRNNRLRAITDMAHHCFGAILMYTAFALDCQGAA